MTVVKGAFRSLCKPIKSALKKRGFLTPTEPQEKAIPLVLKGRNVLLISPTATGKTEAAMLPIFHQFLLSEKRPGVSILYITPLRALNRDLLERLEWWCKELDVKIAVRHGDTDVKERGRQARSPPDLLITTPETLQVLLVGRIIRRHLRSVRWVIVDEVHELATDKRGSQLSLALERLRWTIMGDFQIVGLSATIGSPEKVAKFLVGTHRSYEVVKVPVARKMRLEVLYPKPSAKDYTLAEKLYTHPEVAARLRVMRKLIEKTKATLLFTNTRAISEVLASRFKVWDMDLPISIHHGSLSKPSRIFAEQGLKQGELKGLVCTSSLELGIDVGRIDLCIQYNSPRQVTRLVQRIGRSGHRIGRMAEGYMVTIDSDDTLEAMVIGRRAYDEELEEVIMPEKPFDALINQMAGLLLVKRRWRFDEVLKIFKEAFPYRNLTTKDIIRAASYMHKRYPRLAWVPFEKDVIADEVMLKPKRTEELFHYYFENLSMIPDEVRYLVVDETSDAPVGILDEAFVAEYGQPGTKFIVRGSPWKITRVYGNNIYVKPVRDPTGAIPSWVGEEIPVPFEVALEVGKIRRLVEEAVNKGLDVDEISENLVKVYPISKEDVKRAIQETVDHIKKGYPTPTDKRVVVEEVEDFIIVHCSFGSLVNRTLARVLGHLIAEDTGYTMGVQQDPYRIVLQTMHLCDAQYVKRLLERVGRTNVKRLAVEAVVKSGLFKRRMLHVAKKVGAISRRVSRRGFQQIGLRQMMESFKGTVIYDEAIKDCLITDLDVMNTKRVLKEVLEGNVEVVCVKTESPSPLAAVGIERISRKTDLIPPEKMHRILVEAARVRILNEVKTFVCSRCWKFVKMMKVKDVPHRLKCPVCKSIEIGVSNETDEELKSLLGKSTKASKEAKEEIRDNAGLISRYGKAAVIALSGRRLRSYDVMEVLEEEPGISDRLFELIIEAEKRALRRRFW